MFSDSSDLLSAWTVGDLRNWATMCSGHSEQATLLVFPNLDKRRVRCSYEGLSIVSNIKCGVGIAAVRETPLRLNHVKMWFMASWCKYNHDVPTHVQLQENFVAGSLNIYPIMH